jgi:hypothetical protein
MHSVTGGDNARDSDSSEAPSQQVKLGAAPAASSCPRITVVTTLRFHGEESIEFGNIEHPFHLTARTTQHQSATSLVGLVPDDQQHPETRRIDEFESCEVYYDRLALPLEQARCYRLKRGMVDECEFTTDGNSRIVVMEFKSHVNPLE